MRRTLGLFNWFRKFIPNYSAVANPLNKLLKSNTKYNWTDEQQSASVELKRLLLQSPVLAFPRFDLEFRLAVDTSSKGIGYMLYQKHSDGTPRVVRFGSKGLTKWQSSYGPTKLELLGMVTAILDCSTYLSGKHFIVECDHQALKPLFQKQLRGAIYERWLALLQRYDFSIEYKPAAQMVVPDALSRNSNFQSVIEASLDEDDPFFPYVSEPQTSITLPNGQCLKSLLSQDLVCSNFVNVENVYDADTEDNLEIPCYNPKTAGVNSPIKSHMCETSIQIKDLAPYIDNDLIATDGGECSSTGHNHLDVIDEHSSQEVSSDQPVRGELELDTTSTRSRPQIINEIGVTADFIFQLQRNDPTLMQLISYLKDGELPQSQKAAREILLKHTDFAIFDGILYHSKIVKSKRSRTLNPYQMVLPHDLVLKVLEIYHDSPMGGHGGIQDTLDKIKEHFYCPKLATLVYEYVKSCDFCQKRKMTQDATKSNITAFRMPSEPFEVWEIDLYGRLPPTPDGDSYIFTALDLFSKYLFAIPIRNKDALTVSNALFKLFTYFGVSNTLISDQGSEFIAEIISELCKTLHVTQEFTPSFVHHCLGACERTHSTLAEKLTPYISNDRKSWNKFLPAVVFALNTSANSSSGFSSYEIIYGQRPKFPLTNPIRNFKTMHKGLQTYVKEHTEKLNVIRKISKENVEYKSEKMVTSANKTSKELNIQERSYVYLQIKTSGEGHKLQNRFSGPYVVEQLSSPHMVVLRDPATNKLLNPVHRDRLKTAFIREPTPTNFFTVSNCAKPKTYKSTETQTEKQQHQSSLTEVRKSDRVRRKPIRFRDDDLVNPNELPNFSISSESDGYHKIKRVLGKRDSNYLIQMVGEPADNAVWVPWSALNNKARRAIGIRPPPNL